MKVLITGFTGVQAHASLGQLQLISNITSIASALEDAGHEVEWRPVFPGEALHEYWRVIVAVNGTGSWVSPYALGGLWCIGERPDAVLTLDDWQANKAFCGGFEKERNVVWNPALNRNGHQEAWNDPYIRERIDSAIDELCHVHKRRMLVPTFRDGDLALLGLGAPNAVKYDPSWYMRDLYGYEPEADKRQVWVSAALAPKDSWFKRQGFKWPVEFYGIRKLGQPRVREAELASIYSQSWGIVSAPHPHAGSGWFRVRFLMAALAGSIVYCSYDEGKSINRASVAYENSVQDIEEVSDQERKHLAKLQSLVFLDSLWSQEQLVSFVEQHICEA